MPLRHRWLWWRRFPRPGGDHDVVHPGMLRSVILLHRDSLHHTLGDPRQDSRQTTSTWEVALHATDPRNLNIDDVLQGIAGATGLEATSFSIVLSFPESFLVICYSQEVRDHVLAVSPILVVAKSLSLHPWTLLARASSVVLFQKVTIELDDILEHAWDLDTASKLLAKHAWATASKVDMSTFKLTAWTKDPHSIPASEKLIAKLLTLVIYFDDEMQMIFGSLEPYLREKRMLEYPIDIHLCSIADFWPRTPSTSASSPSDDGDSVLDGNPDHSYGFRQGTGSRLSAFPHRKRGGGRDCNSGSSGGGGGGGVTCAAPMSVGTSNAVALTTTKEALQKKPIGEVLQKHFPKADSNRKATTTACDVLAQAKLTRSLVEVPGSFDQAETTVESPVRATLALQ
uniref:DUF4283 domain-containing protein n=1 Tax=Setaria viridis TaxID=4556 RepID=A0A4U6TRZ8_SETVI|nr:hypothetical protein SEVIR_7G186100v2 [Setaria viridis]